MSDLPAGITSRGPRRRRTRTVFTPALADRLVTLIGGGMSIEAAARFCEVPHATIHGWLREGRQGRPAFAGFAAAVDAARADVERRMLATVVEAATTGVTRRQVVTEVTEMVTGPDGVTRPVRRRVVEDRAPSVEAAQWWLRHHVPTRYGHRVQVAVGPDDPLTEEEHAELAAALAAHLGVIDATAREVPGGDTAVA